MRVADVALIVGTVVFVLVSAAVVWWVVQLLDPEEMPGRGSVDPGPDQDKIRDMNQT